MAAVMPLAAPPPAKTDVQLPFDPQSIALADALDRLRKTQPALFSQLLVAFHAKLDPEFRHIVRAPPHVLPTSQGRVQVAEDILAVLDNCAAIVLRTQQRSTPAAPPRGTP